MNQKKILWVFISIVFTLSAATVWMRLQTIQVTYNINRVTLNTRKDQEKLEQLRVKVAKLRSPKRLERLAKRKFNLAPPKISQIVYIQGKKLR